MKSKKDYYKKRLRDSSCLINKELYLYFFILMKFIFLKPDRAQKEKKIQNNLEKLTNQINEKIIINPENYIYIEYSKKNFMNILNFIKTQNKVYAGEILEGILIIIFSLVIITDKDNCFGKYIYNNLLKLKDINNTDLATWFDNKKNKFQSEEFNDIVKLIVYDASIDDKITNDMSKFQKDNVFFNLLFEIFKTKYMFISNEKKENKTMKYIHKGDFTCEKKTEKIFNMLKDNSSTIMDKDISSYSISKLKSCLYYPGEFGRERRAPIRVIRSFLISVYIYYQNKNSQLMNFIFPNKKNKNIDNNDEENDLAIIPFEYNLKEASIEGKFSYIILSPIRVEPRISKIVLSKNNLRENGLYELSKLLIFNKNIKTIEFSFSLLKSYFVDFFNFGFGIFDNYNVEQLDLSYNYIKEDSEEYLAKLLSHLKGLKTINLSTNDLKGGISHFFITLKRLYRQKKTNLENLNLNKCFLDNESFYELGELLKCKYCKLKRIYLNNNIKPNNINFLKKIKKNKSLKEINFDRSNIWNHDISDINKIISNTNIEQLYLYKNKISDFNDYLRILFRTKLIKEENEVQNINIYFNNVLMNLDLSNNDIWIKNKKQIILLKEIIDKTTVSCLDISHILCGPNPDKIQKTQNNEVYRTSVNSLKESLEVNKRDYISKMKKKKSLEIDIKKYKYLQNENFFQSLDDELINFIDKTIEDNNAQFPLFLREKSLEIIEKINKEEKYENIRKAEKINEISDSEENEEIIEKLVNYMIFKRSLKEVTILNEELKLKKLILI